MIEYVVVVHWYHLNCCEILQSLILLYSVEHYHSLLLIIFLHNIPELDKVLYIKMLRKKRAKKLEVLLINTLIVLSNYHIFHCVFRSDKLEGDGLSGPE